MPTPDPTYAAIEACKRTLAALDTFSGTGLDIPDPVCDAAADALRAMLNTPPTTLDGLRALVRYVIERERGGDDILDIAMADEGEPFADWSGPRPLNSGAMFLVTLATALDQLARQ